MSPKGVVTPKGRRSHTALVFQDSMYVYGGYEDLRGSSSELWAFHFGRFVIAHIAVLSALLPVSISSDYVYLFLSSPSPATLLLWDRQHTGCLMYVNGADHTALFKVAGVPS